MLDSEKIMKRIFGENLEDFEYLISKTLPLREQKVFYARMDKHPKSLHEVGEELGVMRERVRQIEAKAIRRIMQECIIIDPQDFRKQLWELKKIHDDVEELELSVRALNCLRKAGIRTLSKLAHYSQEDLLKIKGMGQKSITKIRDVLWEFHKIKIPKTNKSFQCPLWE